MEWWDSFKQTATSAYDSTLNAAQDWYNQTIAEKTSDPQAVQGDGIPVRAADSNTETTRISDAGWQKIAVGFAALGLIASILRG